MGPQEGGGFRQRWASPMDPNWARSAQDIPMTPDQLRAETRRNSLTRRAEQAALADGITNTRLALSTARRRRRSSGPPALTILAVKAETPT